MGHNRAGANRKRRLTRRKKHDRQQARREYERWVDALESTWLRGEQIASPKLLARIRRRSFRIEWIDERHPFWEEWNESRTNAETDGEGHLRLRRDARTIEVWEEFLHNVQGRLGLLETYPRYELQVKDFMIRHRRLLGITATDARILQRMMHVQMRSRRDVLGVPLVLPSSATRRIRG